MKKTIFITTFLFLYCFTIIFSAVGCSSGCANENEQKTSYEITCTLDQNVLSGSQTVNFFNDTDNSFTELKFNLFGNAFRKDAKYSPISSQYESRAYYNGKSYGDMEILKVSGQNGEIPFSIDGEDKNILTVKLEKEVFPSESTEVTITFKLNLANVIARTGINSNTINLANFYPILCGIENGSFYECVYYSTGDPFFSDCANYTVTLTADEKYVIASSGKIIKAQNLNGKNTNTYTIDNARSFAFVLSDKFEMVTEKVDDVEVNYYFYADLTPQKSLKTAVEAIAYFNKTFGNYAYPTYSVVETEFIQGGMEFTALTMISNGLEEKPYREVIVHETAHQWWQTAVGNNEIRYGFLDEGLTEYSVVLFYENHADYGFTREQLIKSTEQTYKIFCSVYDKVFGKVNTAMVRSLNEFSGDYEYVNISYIKPCIMYDYLRQTIGEEKFFKGLKTYYQNYKFKNAEPYDVVGVYEKLGADTNGFFEGFYNGKVVI